MDVIILFMKLEDKYWGIFLSALFFLYFVWVQNRKAECSKRCLLLFALYGIVSYLVFLCPLTYRAVRKYVPSLSEYYELSHIQLVVPILVIAGTTALLLANKEGKSRVVYLFIGFCALFMAAGDFVFVNPEPTGWAATATREEAQAFDMILSHASENGKEGKIRIWGMEKLMAKSRLYDMAFQPIYGKDVGEHPERYNEALQVMYSNYSAYEKEGSSSINLGDQVDALVSFPFLYPETECDYLILYEPTYQFEDYDTFFGEAGFEMEKRVCDLGYEKVGSTQHLHLFYRQEG